MPVLDPTVDDWAAAFQNLLPQGRVWPRFSSTVQAQAIRALMQAFVRHTESANGLLVDAFPSTTDHLLPEWQATLGLPDPCAGSVTLTLQQEQAQVVARLTGRGSPTRAYFKNIAVTLGWSPATLIEYPPWRCGISSCIDPMADAQWAFAWRLVVPSTSEPDAILVCEIRQRAPAHTVAIFTFDADSDGDLAITDIADDRSY